MKKILLGVTGVRPEMRRGEMAQPLFACASARKIKLLQRPFDPHIHWKRGIETVGKKQHTIGDFPADTAQFHQFNARLGKWQAANFF